jgi:hypothetical protein
MSLSLTVISSAPFFDEHAGDAGFATAGAVVPFTDHFTDVGRMPAISAL